MEETIPPAIIKIGVAAMLAQTLVVAVAAEAIIMVKTRVVTAVPVLLLLGIPA
jgi:hypothetical protein